MERGSPTGEGPGSLSGVGGGQLFVCCIFLAGTWGVIVCPLVTVSQKYQQCYPGRWGLYVYEKSLQLSKENVACASSLPEIFSRDLETVAQSSWHCSMLSKDRANKQNLKPKEVDSFFLCWIVLKESESEVAQSCLTLCNPMDCRFPGSSVHGILQTRVLKWVAISFSRGSSQPRDRAWVARIAGSCFTIWATRGFFELASKYYFFWLSTLCLFS